MGAPHPAPVNSTPNGLVSKAIHQQVSADSPHHTPQGTTRAFGKSAGHKSSPTDPGQHAVRTNKPFGLSAAASMNGNGNGTPNGTPNAQANKQLSGATSENFHAQAALGGKVDGRGSGLPPNGRTQHAADATAANSVLPKQPTYKLPQIRSVRCLCTFVSNICVYTSCKIYTYIHTYMHREREYIHT
jgi:hypothetical protein